MLALVPLLVPAATAAATGTALLLLLLAVDEWWLPQQPTSTTPRFHYFTRFVKWSKTKLTGAVIAARKRLVSALSNSVARRSHGLVVALNNMTEIVARVGDTIEAEAEQTFRALHALRHVTMPEFVQGYVRPVIQTANTALATARAAAQVLTDVSVEFGNGLRALPWGVPIGLPARVATFFTTYKRLWDQVWDELSPRVTQLWTQIVPELRQRIEELERGAAGGLGRLVQELRRRVETLEEWRQDVVMPRLNALGNALDLLRDRVRTLEDLVSGGIELGLATLWEHVEAIEAQLRDVILPRLQALEDAIVPLVEAGIATVLERLDAVEAQLRELIAQGIAELAARLAQVETFLETGVAPQLELLAARVAVLEDLVSGGIELGLQALWARIEAIEAQLRDVIAPAIEELRVGLIEIRERIETDILPRLQAIEALLVPAALAALVLEALRIAAPNLFCRNVTNATRALCADDEAFWEALLAGLVIFAIALNPREIAAAGTALTGFLGGIIAETVDH